MLKKIAINNGQDVLLYREGSGGTVEIFDIVVNSERRKGNGRKLVDLLKEEVDTYLIFAITRSSNQIAQAFYLSCGFRVVANLTRFYDDEGAIMFGLDI